MMINMKPFMGRWKLNDEVLMQKKIFYCSESGFFTFSEGAGYILDNLQSYTSAA
jgi:hypothetical protein